MTSTSGSAGGLSGRIAVITGASAGIGRACAIEFARAGAAVVVNARRAERLDELVREITAAGGRALAVPGDATDTAVIDRILDAARDRFGGDGGSGGGSGGRGADLILVNAGRGLNGSPLTSDEAQWERMYMLNVVGASRLIRAAGRRMSEEAERLKDWPKRARDILILGSSVGKNISPFSSMYGGSKFAIGAIAEAVRRELAPKGVRVSLICPAVVRSEFQEVAGYDPQKFGAFMESIGPVLEPADIARLGVFMTAQPAHVEINDVMIRPTRQEYP